MTEQLHGFTEPPRDALVGAGLVSSSTPRSVALRRGAHALAAALAGGCQQDSSCLSDPVCDLSCCRHDPL